MLRIGIAAAATAALVAVFVAASTGAAPTGAAPAKTVHFSGAIVSGSGHDANLRGIVRLVLGSSASTGSNAASTIAFTLSLSGPSCKTQVIKAPHRCVSLHGTLRGSARAEGVSVPDIGRQFTLGAHGSVAPLGKVTAAGSTSSLGFIARGRFPLSLRLSSPAGRITTNAMGPLVKGFSSPF